ncbi:MAG: molybdopterin cofactor-binding domain-containing protein [Pseudomonadota bacterium]
MNRRTFLKAAASGLVVVVGGGAAVWSQVPVLPKRPEPDLETALGWIAYSDGRYTLTLPRIEMGQNIATGMKQVACAELGAEWSEVDLAFHDTTANRIRATVGSESIMLFAEPLAQACAALRDAIADGRIAGEVAVTARPVETLRALRLGGMIGRSPRIEQGLDIVTGQPLFAADISRPGLMYGRVLRAPASTETASRPVRWDVAAARRVPGFVAVIPDAGPSIGKAEGLGIVANTPGALDAIANVIDVQWEIEGLPANADVDAVMDIDRIPETGTRHKVIDGDPEPGRWTIDMRVDVPFAAHAPIEPRAAVAEWQNDTIQVWAATQDAFFARDILADAFSLSAEQVIVKTCRVGGGFGGKIGAFVEAEAAALARAAGSPVKVQWTRSQEYALGYHRPPSSHRIRARVSQGRITDWDHRQISSHIFFTSAAVPAWLQAATDRIAGDGGVARGMTAPYNLGRTRSSYDVVRLPIHSAAWRGLGAGPNALAIETALDEAAYVAGLDPLDFRLSHMEDPYLTGVLERVAEIASWGTPLVSNRGMRRGRGIAAGVYKQTSYAAAVADVSVDARGHTTVDHMWCVHDCGLVINPDQVRAQCEGNLVWGLGMVLSDSLPLQDGRVIAETFADAPIPTLSQVQSITVDLLESDRPPQGAGETAMVAGPGAIANAIRSATGVRPTRFPMDHRALALTQ